MSYAYGVITCYNSTWEDNAHRRGPLFYIILVILYLSFSVCKSLHSKEAMASGVIPAAPARALATPIPEQSPLAVTRLQQCVSSERGLYVFIGRFGINSTLCSLAQPP